MTILCLVCIWHAVVAQLVDPEDDTSAKLADTIALGVLAAIFVFFQLFFILWIVFVVSFQNRPFRLTAAINLIAHMQYFSLNMYVISQHQWFPGVSQVVTM